MLPALRDEFIEMMQRLEAERMLMLAQVARAAQADSDGYLQMMNLWQGLADGKRIDVDIDPRGRNITDSFDDFVGFVTMDTATLRRHGVIASNEVMV